MTGGDAFNLAEEFAGMDFNEERLEKRFRKTMETLSKDPRKTIYGGSANRAEASDCKSAAIYNLPGNDKFSKGEILRAHRAATIRRMEGHPLILAAQDTMSVNYDSRRKMEGNGYIGDKTMGVNIHSCLAVSPEGVALGALDPMGFNRAERKNAAPTRERQKNRPIEEKESNRRLGTMENAGRDISDALRILHIRDREGDNYELFDKAIQSGRHFPIRMVHNRMAVENGQILDKIGRTHYKGRAKAHIPRDSRRNVKEREVALQVRHARHEVKKPQIKNKNKALLPSLPVTVIYVREENPPKGVEGTAWFLMTSEEVESCGAAHEMVGYYIQRWKTERFHHVLKSGCKIEELQERDMERMKALILMCSAIAVFIMNLTYMARIHPICPVRYCLRMTHGKFCIARQTGRKKFLTSRVRLNRRRIMSAGWEGRKARPAMARRESKPFGLDSKNCIRSWTTVSYSILWVKFRACPAVVH
jgi:hypothetical protein